jgi:hypothetical protein
MRANTHTHTFTLANSDNSSLILLNVRNNKLSGSAGAVASCGNLVQLDISQNGFSGPLPASTDWDELATYHAASNRFTGRLPLNLTAARILEHLDVSSNLLTGFIPPQVRAVCALPYGRLAGAAAAAGGGSTRARHATHLAPTAVPRPRDRSRC